MARPLPVPVLLPLLLPVLGALGSAPPRGCADLRAVLDAWSFAITSELRNLLLREPDSVLPDYGRIRPLAAALERLHRDLAALKVQLRLLSERSAELEATVEQLSRGRGTGAPPRRRGPARAPP